MKVSLEDAWGHAKGFVHSLVMSGAMLGWLAVFYVLVFIQPKPAPPPPPPGPINLPALVKADELGYAELIADTKAERVRYKVMHGPGPAKLLPHPDPKASHFVARLEGEYRVLASAIVDGKIVDTETVVRLGKAPPPEPGPDPPEPKPDDLDDFQKSLKAAFVAEAGADADRAALQGLYKAAGKEVLTTPKAKYIEFLGPLKATGKQLLGERLTATRTVIQGYLDGRLPRDVDQPLDPPTRQLVAKEFAYIAESLGRIK